VVSRDCKSIFIPNGHCAFGWHVEKNQDNIIWRIVMLDRVAQEQSPESELDEIIKKYGDDFDIAHWQLSGGARLPPAGLIAMKIGYESVLARHRREVRNNLRRMPMPSVMVSQMQADRAERNINSLYTKWMVGNTPLGQCTKSMLIEAGNRDGRLGDGHHRNRAFHHGIAAQMPDGDALVKDVLDINIAHEIRAQAFSEAKAA
jgi:hypothetical protein